MAVPNTFATATSAIPLANLDANFAYYDGAFSISGTATTFTGSVTLTSGTINQVQYLNGSKVLIKGNHDTLELSKYAKYFRDVRAYHKLDNEILSHIPLHPMSLWRTKRNASWLNIHAHLHAEEVMLAEGVTDLRYFSCCVERIGYTPISIDEIRNRVAALHKDAI
jgi:calcineurin-like phosphoesterase family protein